MQSKPLLLLNAESLPACIDALFLGFCDSRGRSASSVYSSKPPRWDCDSLLV